jgi:hypothetical protein
MGTPARIERGILVFSIWAALGFLGLGFVLEGFTRNSIGLSLLGTAIIVAALCAHIVVNAIFQQGFTTGEATLGVAAYGAMVLVFIVAWLSGGLSSANYLSGIALFGILAVGFIAYLTTRYGLRDAFSRFHPHEASSKETAR